MNLRFKVRGATVDELNQKADEVLKSFAGGRQYAYDIDVVGEQLTPGRFSFRGEVDAVIRD